MSDSNPVFVVGAGPAGMAAALALSRAGLQVRIIERADLVGGKVNSHHEGGLSLEHGVHGWWVNYINFDRLLRWSDVKPEVALQEAEGSEVVLTDGRRYRLKLLKSNLPSPFFFLLQIAKAPYLSLLDLIRVFPFAIHALAFRHEYDYDRYDGFTFQQLMDYAGVSPRMQKLLFEVFILSFDFTTPDRVSAGCGLSGLQFYALRDQQSILPRWSTRLPADAIFDPIVAQLERQGVVISLATSVENIAIEEGRVTGVSLLESQPAAVPHVGVGASATAAAATLSATAEALPQNEVAAVVLGQVALANVPRDNFIQVGLSPGNAWVGYENDALAALNARCTHEGCTIDWKPDQGAFVCPCHGGRFDRNGNVLQGPPRDALAKLTCRVNGPTVEILGEAASPPQACSDLILAVDLESAKQIVAQTDNLPTDLRHNIGHLDTTPVIVVRIWLNTPKTEPLESAFTPGFQFVDNFFYVNSFDRDIGPEGHVVEVQAYRAAQYLEANDETILTVALSDLAVINSAYTRQNVLHFTVNRYAALFTHYGPAQNQFRPSEASGVEGLHLAGDWTQAPWSVWMMERGVVSGLRAANAVLHRRGLPELEILQLPKEHVLLRVSRALALLARLFVFRGLPRGTVPTEDEMAEHNERDHTVVGWMALYLAVCNFLPLLSAEFAVMRKLWQVPFLLLSVASFFHTEPDMEFQYGNWLSAWKDRSTLQHHLMTLLAIAGIGCEMLIAFLGANSAWILSLFPLGMVATGITFLGHHHGHSPLVERQHRIMAVVFILTGLMWLGSRLLVPLAPLSFAWPLTYGFAAYLFITYTEHELPHAAHDHGEEGDHDHAG